MASNGTSQVVAIQLERSVGDLFFMEIPEEIIPMVYDPEELTPVVLRKRQDDLAGQAARRHDEYNGRFKRLEDRQHQDDMHRVDLVGMDGAKGRVGVLESKVAALEANQEATKTFMWRLVVVVAVLFGGGGFGLAKLFG